MENQINNLKSQSSLSQTLSTDSHPESAISMLEAQNAMNLGKIENSNQEIRNLNLRINELEIRNQELESQNGKNEKNLAFLQNDNEQLTKAIDILDGRS